MRTILDGRSAAGVRIHKQTTNSARIMAREKIKRSGGFAVPVVLSIMITTPARRMPLIGRYFNDAADTAMRTLYMTGSAPVPRSYWIRCPRNGAQPVFVTPMAAQPIKQLPEGNERSYEPRLDGYRALMIKDAK